MSSTSLLMAWAQLLALLAAEVGLIALAVALLRHWSLSAAWCRTFCQAGIVAVLVITACELSGSARVLGGWAAGALAWGKADGGHAEEDAAQADRATAFMPEAQGAPSSLPRPGHEQTKPALAATRLVSADQSVSVAARFPLAARKPDTVSDSMGVLGLWVVWAVGAALAGARACLAQCLFVIFQFRRRAAVEPALVDRVQELARDLGIRCRVRVIVSRRLVSPIAFGLVRPTVGLPPGFAGRFDMARQDAMLAHELAHLAAHDPFWCLLADVAAVLLWWHPGVWWLRRELHLASEVAADEASLLVADGPRVLAECLVELGARLTRPLSLGQLRAAGFRSHLGRRVQRLLRLEGGAWSPPPRLGAALVRIFGPVAIAAIVVLCTAWAAPQALTKGDSMKLMQSNWKRSLATFALLVAFNGPDATTAVAQADKPEAPPAAAPEVKPAAPAEAPTPGPNPQATGAPAAPEPSPLPADAQRVFGQRYGLGGAPPAAPIPATPPNAEQATEAFRRRYGLEREAAARGPANARRPAERGARGAKVEAKLKQIVLDQVRFDGLPLNEVLTYLNDESLKRDPDKTGINFLINPNSRPVVLTGKVDPATGLPLAAAAEPLDVASVVIKFNLPLRNVTMKDLLDAIVTVADHPIEYTLEDYGVVFSAKPEMLGDQPVALAHPGAPPLPAPVPVPQVQFSPVPQPPARLPEDQVEPRKARLPLAKLLWVKPQPFNVDFGPEGTSEQVGPAAAGKAGDFWNAVSVPWNDHHTETDLKFAGGDLSPIEVEMINLGGAWGVQGRLGVKSPMLEDYNYPAGNKGGNSTVILHQVPAGKYSVYIYGRGLDPLYYGDYTLTVGSRDYGRKTTFRKGDTGQMTRWVEGSQYVKFSGVKVGLGEEVKILIRPGGTVTDAGRSFADAYIAGLQLIPAK